MTEQMRFEDYPPGVQCLLKDAMWHLEELTVLEREFRAWQAAQSDSDNVKTATLAEVAQRQWPELLAD